MTQDDLVGHVIAERAADQSVSSEQPEHAGADGGRANHVGRRTVDVLVGHEERQHWLEIDERLRVVTEVDYVGGGERVAIAAFVRVVAPDHDELARPVVRQRAEQHVVDRGENRAARAQPQRNGEHRRGRHRGRSAKHAEGELDVSQPAFGSHCGSPCAGHDRVRHEPFARAARERVEESEGAEGDERQAPARPRFAQPRFEHGGHVVFEALAEAPRIDTQARSIEARDHGSFGPDNSLPARAAAT